MKKRLSKEEKIKLQLLALAVAYPVIILLLVCLSHISQFGVQCSASQDKWGKFGDFFGGVLNPILYIFAFLALLYTIAHQIKSGKEAEERYGQEVNDAKQKHNEQLFDARLFQLLNVNFEIVRNLRVHEATSAVRKFF